MTNDERALNLLGLALKARKVVTGEENVIKLLQNQKAKIVFVASDASDRTIDNFKRKCFFYNVTVDFSFSAEKLTKALGKTLVKILAITDQGFYESLQRLLERGDIYES
ncbi:MAG: ribosomal L7Ae/L30e/S12e/Gadd45 family protein [Bacilli bacterium]|nr:ribosomal L7Ae/L30e/S12e/Gadd45 family protein [Bacilli bacterium]MDY0208682.1 ribosomal L7Ae/L30e/S12e/Gadd45 family protein [Bacilli bacterium]